MAVRKYDTEGAKAMSEDVTQASLPLSYDKWQYVEARRTALEIARGLSEIGSKAEDVVADAKLYASFLTGE